MKRIFLLALLPVTLAGESILTAISINSFHLFLTDVASVSVRESRTADFCVCNALYAPAVPPVSSPVAYNKLSIAFRPIVLRKCEPEFARLKSLNSS